jgi:hypothetical protein
MRNVRANYLTSFARHFERLKAEERNVHVEIRVEYGDPKRYELYRLAVIDVIEKDAEGKTAATRIVTSPIVATFPGLPISSPIAWHAVTFRCNPLGFPEEDLVAWGNRWIRDEAPPLGPQDGLTGIIHFVSQPELHAGLLEFEVDFGSAPIEAFEELTTVLSGCIKEILTYEDSDA